jgi:hypothetical protein
LYCPELLSAADAKWGPAKKAAAAATTKIFLMVHLLFSHAEKKLDSGKFCSRPDSVAAPIGQQDGTNAHSSVVHLAADVSYNYMGAEIVGGVRSAALSFRGTSIAVISRGALSMMPTSFSSVPLMW